MAEIPTCPILVYLVVVGPKSALSFKPKYNMSFIFWSYNATFVLENFHKALEMMSRAVSSGQQPGAKESVSYLTNIENNAPPPPPPRTQVTITYFYKEAGLVRNVSVNITRQKSYWRKAFNISFNTIGNLCLYLCSQTYMNAVANNRRSNLLGFRSFKSWRFSNDVKKYV